MWKFLCCLITIAIVQGAPNSYQKWGLKEIAGADPKGPKIKVNVAEGNYTIGK